MPGKDLIRLLLGWPAVILWGPVLAVVSILAAAILGMVVGAFMADPFDLLGAYPDDQAEADAQTWLGAMLWGFMLLRR